MESSNFIKFKVLAEQGDACAQCNLGDCYRDGIGIEKDYVQAVKWYKLSAAQQHSDAQCNLGNAYYVGNGVEQDYTKAVSWYRLSAEQGNSAAQCNLGICYQYGLGVNASDIEAKIWYGLSAKNGNETAIKNLKKLNITAKEKFRNSGNVDAVKAAEILENIEKEPLGIFEIDNIYRCGENPGDFGVPLDGRSSYFQIYKIYDHNNPEKTGRKISSSFGARILSDGTQISFVVVPQLYVGGDPLFSKYRYEFFDGANTTEFDDVSDCELYVLARDYPINISTIAQLECLRQELEYRNNYNVLKTDGTMQPVDATFYRVLAEGALKKYLPEEITEN